MSAKQARFRKVDLTRAIAAATAGGLAIGKIEIDPISGKIVLVAANKQPAPDNPVDEWLERHARSA